MSGFAVWAQSPNGTLALTCCALVIGIILGELDGMPRGRRRQVRDMRERRAEARAIREFQLLREPEPELVPMPLLVAADPASALFWHNLGQAREKRTSTAAFLDPPEVAHEWDGHVGQALALARGGTDEEFTASFATVADEIIAYARAASDTTGYQP